MPPPTQRRPIRPGRRKFSAHSSSEAYEELIHENTRRGRLETGSLGNSNFATSRPLTFAYVYLAMSSPYGGSGLPLDKKTEASLNRIFAHNEHVQHIVTWKRKWDVQPNLFRSS
jgi:hypothetical protein